MCVFLINTHTLNTFTDKVSHYRQMRCDRADVAAHLFCFSSCKVQKKSRLLMCDANISFRLTYRQEEEEVEEEGLLVSSFCLHEIKTVSYVLLLSGEHEQ